ncbi:hypothetical protein [Blastococcus sp. SYSU D00820]
MTETQQLSSRARRRAAKRQAEALPPHDGPEAVAPALSWVRRLTPFNLGRRRVRLQMSEGWLTVVRTPLMSAERIVVSAPVREFHSVAPSRGGRGLHLWHGDRVFRLRGRSTAKSDSTDSVTLGDDPISAVIGIILLPVYLLSALGAYADKIRSEEENAGKALRWLGPVVGPPPPGLHVRPPLPGWVLALPRWTLRLAVVGALVGGLVYLFTL